MKILILIYTGQAGPFVMMDIADGFNRLGHETMAVNVKDILDARDRFGAGGYAEVADRIRNVGADFVVGYGNTTYIDFPAPDGSAGNLFESLNLPHVAVYYDNPMDGEVFPLAAPLVDSDLHYMFVWDRYYACELKKLGFRNVHYMPIATNENRYIKLPGEGRDSSRFKCDVSFAGAWSPKRELALSRLAAHDVALYGYWWDKARPALAERFRGHVDNVSELPLLYNHSKINVNVTMEQGISSLNMRVFDCMACEGFLITDYKEDLEQLFDMDKEIVCYRDVDDLEQLVSYYLNHDAARREKAKLARMRVLADHTYTKRVEFIIRTLRDGGVGE